MAASTRSRVALLTLGWLLITLDTVWCETPARSATSSSRGSRALLLVMGLLCATPRRNTNTALTSGHPETKSPRFLLPGTGDFPLFAKRVGPVGIEPTTHGLKVRCSTN